jgi:multiple sugar transport system substrate-binding protein
VQSLLRQVTAWAWLAACCAGVVGCARVEGGSRLVVAVNAGVEGDALKAAAADYQTLTGARMEIIELPYANLFEKAMLDLDSRTGAYDVIMMDDPWFPRLASAGKLTALEPLYRQAGQPGPDDDFVATSLGLCRDPSQGNRLYALPYVGNSQLFFYRRDLFEKYGLAAPKTWTEVREAARRIGAGEGIYGYVMRAAPGNASVTDFMPILWAFGAELLGPDDAPQLDTPEAAAALGFMVEMGKWSPPGYVSFNADEVAAHLLQATAAMSINWPAWVLAMDEPTKSKAVGKIAFAPLPGEKRPGQAAMGNWLLAIPAGSRNAGAAFAFVRWATEPAQMRKAAERGNPPTRRSVFQDADLASRFRAYPVQYQSLSTGRPRPRTVHWNEIENVFGTLISQANAGSVTVAQALVRAQHEISEIRRRNP